jgi:hypothetical protein
VNSEEYRIYNHPLGDILVGNEENQTEVRNYLGNVMGMWKRVGRIGIVWRDFGRVVIGYLRV